MENEETENRRDTRRLCHSGFVLRYDQIGRIFETLTLRLSKNGLRLDGD